MYNPHADGTDRGNPQDAGEAYVCQRTLVLFFCEKRGISVVENFMKQVCFFVFIKCLESLSEPHTVLILVSQHTPEDVSVGR